MSHCIWLTFLFECLLACHARYQEDYIKTTQSPAALCARLNFIVWGKQGDKHIG